MKISGFTFLRNASKLYYPVKESILSILDIVDEFVVAVGAGDADDNTIKLLENIGSEKIKIIQTIWDTEKYPRGMEHAHQTDIAKDACSGDWVFYLQGDEVIHEKDHPAILETCQKYLNRPEVEGFLFRYLHFYGDYDHYFRDHCWYRFEIRIVRNLPEIHSFESAQSFRRIPNFDGVSYREKEGTFKLKVVRIDADIYHYGWVRPPKLMLKKRKYFSTTHRGANFVKEEYKKYGENYDYGRMDRTTPFKGTHPAVMAEKIKELDWKEQLRYSGPITINRPPMKHERLKYRLLVDFENKILGGRQIGGYKNYILIDV